MAAGEDIMMPTMTPKSPSALPKISIMRILTKSVPFCASANAHPEPVMPTHTPQKRLLRPTQIRQDTTGYDRIRQHTSGYLRPTQIPALKIAYAGNSRFFMYSVPVVVGLISS